ncbi:MAG TPA: sulfotransferase [Longimicrobium sp.]|nr:sulfotransferase [Longimicrobium sp.]
MSAAATPAAAAGVDAVAAPGPEGHRFLFICGVHRSGTSIVHRVLRDHPEVSGFTGTGAPEDEGQHLQSVFLPAKRYGGPGRFGFDPRAHLTEDSPLATPAAAARLWREWSRHWELDRAVLAEKSPPNLLRMRFLQACFPASYFLVVTRHPVAAAYATQAFTRRRWRKWRQQPVAAHLRHWFHCHRIFQADRPHVRNLMVLRYEDFAARPQEAADRVAAFVGLAPAPVRMEVRGGTNDRYLAQWRRDLAHWWRGPALRRAAAEYEAEAAAYGYTLVDPS